MFKKPVSPGGDHRAGQQALPTLMTWSPVCYTAKSAVQSAPIPTALLFAFPGSGGGGGENDFLG